MDPRRRGLAPLLRGESPPWRSEFLYAYHAEPGYSTPSQLALREADAKLIVYPEHPDWSLLFDLRADPWEMHDLANDPAWAERRRAMQQALEREARALGIDVGGSGADSGAPQG